MDDLRSYFANEEWAIVHEESKPARAASYLPTDDLMLSGAARRFLSAYPGGIYRHQHESVRRFLAGSNVAITTPTASGKTLVFNLCALDLIARGNGVVIALYPLKALGREQAGRWQKAVADAGLSERVGYIDGSIAMAERLHLLAACRIVVMTPDILHAWLLRKTGDKQVSEFVRRLELVIVDEAHAYTSVFGSNSAFVFRRLAHARNLFGGGFRYIAASATMDSPLEHLQRLTGCEFEGIGEELDTAPKAPVTTLLVRPTRSDGLTALSRLIAHVAENTAHQTIAFVDSRQLAEQAAVIAGRPSDKDDELPSEVDDPNDDPVGTLHLSRASVLPYRAGYDDDDRAKIHGALAKGKLKAVVSTSALELGIDIPGLSLCVLYGVPLSGSSLRQRYGRVGRASAGMVVIIDDGSPRSKGVFANPDLLWSLPLTRSSLYLHNRQAQYIHAMCLARFGGEDEVFARAAGAELGRYDATGLFPEDFLELCRQEKNGIVPSDLRQMKEQAGDSPNLTFPIRDIGQQFSVVMRRGPDEISLGTLSHGQLMREAYPGAVYYHRAIAYRVTKVAMSTRKVSVRKEKRYFTKPTKLPLQIFPNVAPDDLYADVLHGPLRMTECNLAIRETVVGFKERRGNNEFNVAYPLDASLSLFFDQPYFNRNMFTSGVVITHPALDGPPTADLQALSDMLLEAFLMEIPFDRQDIGAGFGVFKQEINGFPAGTKFICLYDKQHSLRLSGEIVNETAIRAILARAVDMCSGGESTQMQRGTFDVMARESLQPQLQREQAAISDDDRYVQVILPGEIGVDISRDNVDFKVAKVFFHPTTLLSYRGVHVADSARAIGKKNNGDAETVLSIDRIKPIKGESKCGWWDLEMGELIEQLPGEF